MKVQCVSNNDCLQVTCPLWSRLGPIEKQRWQFFQFKTMANGDLVFRCNEYVLTLTALYAIIEKVCTLNMP